MKRFRIGTDGPEVSRIALGLMRIDRLGPREADDLVRDALDQGVDFFDHADIYGGGRCEEIFGGVLSRDPSLRGRIAIQSKVGIRRGEFDFSKEHILEAVDGCLARLKTDRLDFLLLHRPDALVEPEEVAEAFDVLERTGKALRFGVSNQNPMQIELLQRTVKQRLCVNQLQLSLAYTPMIDAGLHVNMTDPASVVHDGSVLDYCRLKGITIQPWSPFQHGFFGGAFLGDPKFPELNAVVDRMAAEKGVAPAAIAIAWILRHPARMQPVLGTTSPKHLREACRAADVDLTRTEWYELYRAAGNKLP